MAWIDSLTTADVALLAAVRARQDPRAFELYVVLALLIRINGPIPAQDLDSVMEAWDSDVWPSIAGYFELRGDMCLHVKDAA